MAMPNIQVINTTTKRNDDGPKVQIENITAAKAVADVVRTCLGPRSMLKMLMDPMGGIVMTSDGNAILREIMVQHPAAKSMIEIARTQDEEVGDGTTSVIVLAGEMMAEAEQFFEQKMHPTVVIAAYLKALDDIVDIMENEISVPIDVTDKAEMTKIVKSCIGTKLIKQWEDMACEIALDAVGTVKITDQGRTEVDIKRYAKVEKVPGGELEDSEVLKGVMVNKDITHSKMRRRIEKPRILLLDCGLEYTKGESQTNIEVTKEEDFTRLLELEEEYIKEQCGHIIAAKPDLVFTEKGVSDLAQHYLVKHNITAIRRVRKSDNNRIARACGAQIVNRCDEIKEEDMGLGAGLFEVKKLGDEYFSFITECENPKACTILLRGPSQDLLKEVERNLQDAMNVARNVVVNPRLVPGGGATEIALSCKLLEKAKQVEGVAQWPYKAVAKALEVIPRTLVQNCGASTIRLLTELRAKHNNGEGHTWGIDGNKGKLADMNELGIWEPLSVKLQTIKTAIETASLLMRIDAIVSGLKAGKH
jgi:T-complex protein 1 subunit gamma